MLANTPRQEITASFPSSAAEKLSNSQASPLTSSKLGCLKGKDTTLELDTKNKLV